MRVISSALFACVAFVACHQTPPPTSTEKVDIGLPANQINKTQLTQFATLLQSIRDKGQGTVDPTIFFSILPMTPQERSQIDSMRFAPAAATCMGMECVINSQGVLPNGLTMKLSLVNLPGLGSPSIHVDPNIAMRVKLHRANTLEVCSITGLKVKKFVWVRVNGALFDGASDTYKLRIAERDTRERCLASSELPGGVNAQ